MVRQRGRRKDKACVLGPGVRIEVIVRSFSLGGPLVIPSGAFSFGPLFLDWFSGLVMAEMANVSLDAACAGPFLQ